MATTMTPTQLRKAFRVYKTVAEAARVYKAAEAAYRIRPGDFGVETTFRAANKRLLDALALMDQMEGR